VIIIGAGVSGLAAAKRLQERGISYLILEGSHRVGGRLCSKSWNGATIELGANWVTGCVKQNPIYQLAVEELKLNGTIDERKTETFDFRCCSTGIDLSPEGRLRKEEFNKVYEEISSPVMVGKKPALS
jgi:predicted NAD/FAD-dependent oxidoreductase